MNNKHFDAILCIISTFLWFRPFHTLENIGGFSSDGFQAGNHIGGVAYMALVLPVLYFYFSWNKDIIMKLILSTSQLLLCLYLLIPRIILGNVRYGIIFLTLVALFMLIKTVKEYK